MTREELAAKFNVSLIWIDEQLGILENKFKITPDVGIQLIACKRDRYNYGMPHFLRVFDKSNKMVPMVPTRIHLKFKKHQRKLSYSVKPRQIWFTTFMGSDYYMDAVEGSGKKVLFINLDTRVTEEVFNRVKIFHENFTLPILLPKERRNTTKKLSWENGGSYDAVTCNNDAGPDAAKMLGRSCTVQRIHVTEVAYMKYYREFMSGLMDSKPVDAYACFESTGNGAQGGFYEDCMEIQTKGELVAPNVWVFGDKSLHFFAWWEHPEYRLERDPLIDFGSQMTAVDFQVLNESETEHIAEMKKDPEFSEEDAKLAMNWRRWKLFNEKGFLRNPQAAITEMDREYPAKLRHAFSTSGSAFLSTTKTDLLEQIAIQKNKELGKPFYGRLIEDGKGGYSVFPGSMEIMFWELPVKERWENRYCIGSDVGGGNHDSDPDCIFVKDRVTGQYVACVHSRVGPVRHGELIQALGHFYQNAMLCHEVNNHGIGVSIKLWEDEYPEVYRHKKGAEQYKGMGFTTSEESRKIALQILKDAYEDKIKPFLLFYLGFYKEAKAFATPPGRPNGKPVGQNGEHDDCIIAAAITEFVDSKMDVPKQLEEVKVKGDALVKALKPKGFW